MSKFVEIKNPYTLQFSYIPPQFIERTLITNEIINNFIRDIPTYRGMFITGVRGSGKTVMLGDIRNKIGEQDDWITVDLNPESNLLDSLARNLYLIPQLKTLFVKAKLDFSVLGIGVSIERASLIASNEEDALKMMLDVLKKAKKKLLITIDEITYSKDVAKFSHALSSYAGMDYDIYLLMTGLKENIKAIKNQKSLTFLYRAKVTELEALNVTAICNDYQKTLEVSRERAEQLAFKTKGYSLAFQALGYHYWNEICRGSKPDDVDMKHLDSELDESLSELSYDKIWDELSESDKKVLWAMKKLHTNLDSALIKVEDIRKAAAMTSNTFTTYRTRLIDSGVVDGKQHGYLSFKLPRFEEFMNLKLY